MEQLIPLQALGIEKRWPRLARIQGELAGFERDLHKAESEMARLRAELGPARERDLGAEVEAMRAKKPAPKAVHEPKVRAELEAAERRRDVMQRALQSAHEDYARFVADNQPALLGDVVEARRKVAQELAEHARAALAAYGRWEELRHVVKRLQPPPPANENAHAASVMSFVGVQTTRRSGPDRGTVEQLLGYLASLGDTAEGGTDGA